MIPKRAFSKVVQSLKRIEQNWLQDRKDNPNTVPYEIDSELTSAIERALREEGVSVSRDQRSRLVFDCVAYLVKTGKIVKSPYGGHMFNVPDGHEPLPSRDEFVADALKRLNDSKFFR